MTIPFFRHEVVAAHSNKWSGTVVLARPISMRTAAAVAGLILIGIALFLTFGHYTRKVRVTGQIVPAGGSIKVVASQFGRIAKRIVDEGSRVSIGQPMFELTSERAGSGGGVDARINVLLATRRDELVQSSRLQAEELTARAQALAKRQRSIMAEIESREQEVALQARQVQSARSKLKRHTALAKKGFLSPAQLGLVADEVTGHLARSKALESNVITVRRELLQVVEESDAIKGKIALAASQAGSNLAALGQEEAEHDGRSRIQIIAPAAGIVTALTLDPGQSVPPGTVLATILPADGELEAHMMVPSRAVGFIEPGQVVLLRLSSFPYQKFGQVAGTVTRVERSPIAEAQGGRAGIAEPVYRITVKLSQQSVSAYGRKQMFKAGMTLDADILQDRRRLIEWVIDPIISAAKGRTG